MFIDILYLFMAMRTFAIKGESLPNELPTTPSSLLASYLLQTPNESSLEQAFYGTKPFNRNENLGLWLHLYSLSY